MSAAQPILLQSPDLLQWFSQYVLVFARIGAFCFASPVIGSRLIPRRVRLLLAVFTTVIVAPGIVMPPVREGLSLAFLLMLAEQVFVGLLLGFALQVVFQVFVVAGQLIAMQMGLGFSSMNDPINGVSVAVLSQFFLSLNMLLFMQMHGHLAMIEMIARSFTDLPAGFHQVHLASLQQLMLMMSWMFGAALLMALPVVTALLLVSISFGVMSRAAPQLNIFSLGFPMTLVIGLVAIFIAITRMADFYTEVNRQGFDYLQHMLQ